jgi:AcrR family transcriptional regulator
MTKIALVEEANTREALISAAQHCIARFGLAKTTMSDVASAATVHRATVYRYFTDREELVAAVFLREAAPLLAQAVQKLETSEDVAEGLVDALVESISEMRRSEIVQTLLSSDSPVAAHRSLMSEQVANVARTTAEPALRRAVAEGRLRPGVTFDDASDWILRVGFSLLSDDQRVSMEDQRQLLKTFLVPALFKNAT